GPAPGGLESTVLDLSRSPTRLLRPGLIHPSTIEVIVGLVERSAVIAPNEAALPSPGMLPRHYAPRAPLEGIADSAAGRVAELAKQGQRVGWLTFGEPSLRPPPNVTTIALPPRPAEYAARLYAVLHELDDAGVERIVVELPPDREEWLTVRDRLRRASA